MERSESEDEERDQRDRPAQILDFFGLKPGDHVLDLNAGTGYYTERLARIVGVQGRVISHNHPGAVAMLGADALSRRYRDGRLPNVAPLLARHEELKPFAQSLDMILMSMVYHDTWWHNAEVDWGPVDRHALLTNLHTALRPDGVVGVIDHVATAGADPEFSVRTLHRIDPQIVERDFLRAGFRLEAHSDLLRNPDDDHQRNVFDPAMQARTDRFVMRFRRSAG
jgi:predicted methyltransferase